MRRMRLPVPTFITVSYRELQSRRYRRRIETLSFPVAVRSTYTQEDGAQRSLAGHFLTRLNVYPVGLERAMEEVFASYPETKGQEVIIQEMVRPTYGGVLFAYRRGVWKLEYSERMEQKVVDGRDLPKTILLPQFGRMDIFFSRWWPIWRPYRRGRRNKGLVRPLIGLSSAAGRLLSRYRQSAPYGLDIEFVICQGKLYLLQARPITTPDEAEEVLTSANHKEILPPKPSPLMTSVIESCSQHLFAYYQRLDPSLGDRRFIEVSGHMPWINLSALLETMVQWGLPTSLVCESVGAEDVYRVKARPYRWIRKGPVFVRVLRDQFATVGRVRRWVRRTQRYLLTETEGRRLLWRNHPELAFNNWLTNLQLVYTELVTLMQALTGAMSGPVKLFDQLGVLHRLRERSESTRYLEAYRLLVEGKLSRADFVEEYGHRGFYESDIGQPRFLEYDEAAWAALLGPDWAQGEGKVQLARRQMPRGNFLVRPFVRMIHTREWLRDHAMRYFALLRQEIQEATQARFGDDFDFAAYQPADLLKALEGQITPEELKAIRYPEPQGWQPDTFLRNRLDRQLPVSYLSNVSKRGMTQGKRGIGIYPGKVRGQIWRVEQADLSNLQKPDFPTTILLTESLDPGWIPYFVQVEGVVSRVGGILSHASIILRESQIPSITRFGSVEVFQTGDWVELDARKGTVKAIKASPSP
jgi:rifampicin phosphotransferase